MKISDVERITGLTAKTIRLYESKKLICVSRSNNSYREYSDENVEMLNRIKQMRKLGIAIADIKLWCDGIIDVDTLIKKRRSELENLEKLSARQKKECCDILENKHNFDKFFDFSTEKSFEYEALSLGIDIGTTSISAQLIDLKSGKTVHMYTFEHSSEVEVPGFSDGYAHDAVSLSEIIINFALSVIDTYSVVKSIGITGQMHGIVCLDEDNNVLSPFYTWQNKFGARIVEGRSICRQIQDITGESVPTGYGFVTLYALQKLGLLNQNAVKICTIPDFAAMKLCGNSRVITHPTNAAGLGFFNVNDLEFSYDKLFKLGISESFIPTVIKGNSFDGSYGVIGSFQGIPVACAIGDNQAAAFASLKNDNQILINVGTGSQISVPITTYGKTADSCIEIRPYFDGKRLLSGSCLCGGKAYAVLADFFVKTAQMLGMNISRQEVYSKMESLLQKNAETKCGREKLDISTQFAGTRYDDAVRGYIKNIGMNNLIPEALIDGVLEAIIREMYDMYEIMRETAALPHHAQTVVSGNAMRLNPALRRKISDIFETEIFMTHKEEAAYGAALYSAIACGIITRKKSFSLIQYEKDGIGNEY
ncbi:MAG: MerR family transcriptional regulator [Clostridiales bacterium]|nr:MerR family transcriptional regulator [Clostridiales bacterium]